MSGPLDSEVQSGWAVLVTKGFGDPEVRFDPGTGRTTYTWTAAGSAMLIDHATITPEMAADVLRERVTRRLEAGGFREVTE